jgi:hypothetical protein
MRKELEKELNILGISYDTMKQFKTGEKADKKLKERYLKKLDELENSFDTLHKYQIISDRKYYEYIDMIYDLSMYILNDK